MFWTINEYQRFFSDKRKNAGPSQMQNRYSWKSCSTEVFFLTACKPIFQSSPMPQRPFPLVRSGLLLCTCLHAQSLPWNLHEVYIQPVTRKTSRLRSLALITFTIRTISLWNILFFMILDFINELNYFFQLAWGRMGRTSFITTRSGISHWCL